MFENGTSGSDKGIAGCVRTYSGGVWVEVEGHPGRAELVVGAWVQLFIRLDCQLKLLLANIAPGAHCVANSDNLELRHRLVSSKECTIEVQISATVSCAPAPIVAGS